MVPGLQTKNNMPMKTPSLYHILILGLSLFIGSCAHEPKEPLYDLHIKDVQIIDEKGKLLKEQHLFIQSDTIAAIIDSEEASLPQAREVIDAKDQFLMLGLWDNHVHFRGGADLIPQNKKFLDTYLKYGVTTVRDAGGDLTPEVLNWNKQIAANTALGPKIYTSGPKIDGPKARWAGSIAVGSQQDITNALDSLQTLGVDYVKLYDSTIDGTLYLKTIAAAHERGMISSGHMPFSVTLGQTVEAGIGNIEHLYYILKGCSNKEAEITEQIRTGALGFWDSMQALIDSYDPAVAQSTFANLKANNVCVTPTLHIGSILSNLDQVDHSQDPQLQELSTAFKATYQGRINSALAASATAKSNRKKLQQFFMTLTQDLNEAGVCLLAGSDAGAYNSYVYPGISIHKELEQLVAAGLSPAQALQTSSLNGSTFLNVSGYQMQVGGKANLVLLDKNPLRNISNTQSIALVIQQGKVIDKEIK